MRSRNRRMCRRRFLLFCTTIVLLAIAGAGCVTAPKLTPEGRKRDIQFLADWARDYSPLAEPAQRHKGNPSYEALLPQYLAYAERAQSDEEFYRVVRGYYDLICSVGHRGLVSETRLRLGRIAILLGIVDYGISPFMVEKARYWARLAKRYPDRAQPPFEILRKGDRYFTDSEWQGDGVTVPRGSQIVTVNGMDCSAYLDFLRKNTYLRYQVVLAEEEMEEKLLVINESPDFTGWQVEFLLPNESAERAFVPKLKPRQKRKTDTNAQKRNCTCVELNDEVGYIRVEAMSPSWLSIVLPPIRHKDRRIIRAFLKNARGKYRKLIIDVRNNGGGSVRYVYESLISSFLDEPAVYDQVAGVRRNYRDELPRSVLKSLRKWISGKKEHVVSTEEIDAPPGFDPSQWVFYRITRRIEPRHRYDFDGDLYVLVDEGTFSAADDYANAIKRIGFAKLVGQSTGGGCAAYIGSPVVQLPASGMVLRIEPEIVINPDGSINELVGTPPDVELPSVGPPQGFAKEDLLTDEWIRTVIDDL